MQTSEAGPILQFLLSTLEQEIPITRRVIAAVPANQTMYKPDARCMSALELSWHIGAAETFFATAITDGAFPQYGGAMPETIKSSADVLAWYDGQVANLLPKLKALTPEQASKILESPFGAKPAIQFLGIMINHTVHHRGQLSSYLRPMGAKVPSIYGTSLDDKAATATAA